MKEINTDTIVLGAGLTGLTTAFYLSRQGRDFIVLEQEAEVGGVIHTLREKGFVYETGPNTGVIGQPEVVDLFDDLGGDAELEKAGNTVNKRYVLKDGRWHAMPMGLLSGIRTPLFSLKDKFRLLGEPWRQPGTDPEESLEQLVLRRMGKSFLQYAVDPFILGIYAGDPARLIPRYALPKLYRLEQEYGSFIGGSIRKSRKKKSPAEMKTTREIFSVKGGLGNLTHALWRAAGKDRFLLDAENIVININEKGGYTARLDHEGDNMLIHGRRVISTVGSHALPGLFPFFPEKDMEVLTTLRYARVAELVLGFNRWEGMELDGFGGLVPFSENRDILGVLFISSFLEGRAPRSGALLSVFAGGVRKPHMAGLDDQTLTAMVKKEFLDLMGIKTFEPDLLRIFRYDHAIPQYEAGTGERIDTIRRLEEQFPGIVLGGNQRDGIGMADRIRQGVRLANEREEE